MKKILNHVLLLTFGISTVIAISSVAVADGRDVTRYAYEMVHPQPWMFVESGGEYTKFNNRPDITRWRDEGRGVWRTDDGSGNPTLNDRGYSAYDLTHLEDEGFDLCRVLCEKNQQCKGIEYTAFANAMSEALLREPMREGDFEYYLNKCEIHYDDFLSCDSSIDPTGGIRSDFDKFNGCWEKLH